MLLVVLLCLFCLTSTLSVKDFSSLDHLQPKASYEVQTVAAQDLIKRILPTRASDFNVFIDKKVGPPNRDTFNIKSSTKSVNISATSGVAIAMGFYYYLNNYCGCQVTWAGSQLNLPKRYKVIISPGVTITTNDRFRYYLNVCTVSYSFAFYNWTDWERQIDWMALHGINLPLAFTGQEAIFQRVYMRMGLTFEELQSHFSGPAFLAWSRMGNIRGWGGPLSQAWIDDQLVLQHKILDRMRSLGMIPVLPGFAGHVPQNLTRIYPNANVSRLGDWGHFGDKYCCTYLLDFKDPLFVKIGSAFIQEMQTEFGIDHVYNADTFNEMTPISNSTQYLATAGRKVYEAMNTADPKAVWLMQGWLFQKTNFWKQPQIKALLQSVPIGKMIILDLSSELDPIYQTTESYYGQPFIWCMLHNFGGTMEFYGMLDTVNIGPFIGRNFSNSSMIGIGLTPEGINQNEIMYEFMMENSWRKQPRNITEWISNFAVKRYGSFNRHVDKAWQFT
ncbi:hypothetical protein KUTeg_015185 [Tegillarca granosa]|uniref:Alpha-N-acetylglucosaminidase n=1 Tax=Tegillarca granosa TaxID=220873 RepID=A0ABQ9EPD4_TEGGR|nr:hypothetical protein KUTeg_015185 [Tegillarca granosa]